jgi:hypothetical protein
VLFYKIARKGWGGNLLKNRVFHVSIIGKVYLEKNIKKIQEEISKRTYRDDETHN